jgi:putative endonuclease
MGTISKWLATINHRFKTLSLQSAFLTPHATLGQAAEHLAKDFLCRRGLLLLTCNYHCRFGEIDLVMQEKHCLVFVEVRYRSQTNHGHAEETITLAKQRKVIKAAEHYLFYRKKKGIACRFDVITISGAITNPVVNWIPNAFNA